MKITDINNQNLDMVNKSTFASSPKPPAERTNPEMWKAAESFEAIFMSKLFKTMQSSLPEGALSPDGLPNMMFERVMGEAMSAGGGIGLAEIIYRDMVAKVGEIPTELEDVSSINSNAVEMPEKVDDEE